MTTRCWSPVRGVAARFTLLDECGDPQSGVDGVGVTSGFVEVSFTPVYTSGQEVARVNGDGGLCSPWRGRPRLRHIGVSLTLCGMDPALVSMLTDYPALVAASGDVVGWTAQDSRTGPHVAVEVWGGITGIGGCADDTSEAWTYVLLPHVRGLSLRDVTVGNGPILWQLSGTTDRRAGWAGGLWPVLTDAPTLPVPITDGQHRLVAWTTVAPPEGYCGLEVVPGAESDSPIAGSADVAVDARDATVITEGGGDTDVAAAATLIGIAAHPATAETEIPPVGFPWQHRFGGPSGLHHLGFGNGLFVAQYTQFTVANTQIWTSNGTSSWVPRTPMSNNGGGSWCNPAWGAFGFAVVGQDYVRRSVDGLTWTTHNAAVPREDWFAAAYGAGRYVFFGRGTGFPTPVGTTVCYTSVTGAPGTYASTPFPAGMGRIMTACYGDPLDGGSGFLVAGEGGAMATSPDGLAWTAVTPPDAREWKVAFGNGRYVAVTGTGAADRAMWSLTGATGTWNVVATPFAPVNPPWGSVCYGGTGDMFMAVAGGSNIGFNTHQSMYTYDGGATWTMSATPPSGTTFVWPWNDVERGNGLFVAIQNNPTSSVWMTTP